MAASEEDLRTMDKAEYEKRLQRAYDILTECGSHYVVDSVVPISKIPRRVHERPDHKTELVLNMGRRRSSPRALDLKILLHLRFLDRNQAKLRQKVWYRHRSPEL